MNQTIAHHHPRIRPFSGWALEAAVALDQAHPGFLAKTLRASDLTRQVRFAALAAVHFEPPSVISERFYGISSSGTQPPSTDPMALIAQRLLDLPPGQVLQAVFGSCPKGLLGLFARLGDSPISPDRGVYRLAWSLYAEPQHRQRARLLMRTEGLITAAKLRVVS